MKKLILLLPLFLLGCETLGPKVDIVEVKVPVIKVPAPPPTIKPVMMIEGVTVDKDGIEKYIKTLESDMVRIKYYAYSLEQVIQTYYELSVLSEQGTPKEK